LAAEKGILYYLSSIMQILTAAAKMSLNKGDEHDADDQKLYCDLRFSIVDCYLSVLHGISDGGDNNNPEIQNSVMTIY
jgi:hypothetical protein